MAKKSKSITKYLLPKKRGKTICDELWTKLVRLEHNNECAICKDLNLQAEDTKLDCHHIISRRVFKYRWDAGNGVLLCPKHHEFDLHISAHTAPWGFFEWLEEYRPEKYAKFLENKKDLEYEGQIIYDKIYMDLEEQYKKITGDYFMIKRIDMYRLALNKEEIIMQKNMADVPMKSLAEKYGVTEGVMKKFLSL